MVAWGHAIEALIALRRNRRFPGPSHNPLSLLHFVHGNMDNADLEKLAISPGKLTPKFHPNTTEYSVTLGSDVKQIKINPLTSDSGASYSISVSSKILLPSRQISGGIQSLVVY